MYSHQQGDGDDKHHPPPYVASSTASELHLSHASESTHSPYLSSQPYQRSNRSNLLTSKLYAMEEPCSQEENLQKVPTVSSMTPSVTLSSDVRGGLSVPTMPSASNQPPASYPYLYTPVSLGNPAINMLKSPSTMAAYSPTSITSSFADTAAHHRHYAPQQPTMGTYAPPASATFPPSGQMSTGFAPPLGLHQPLPSNPSAAAGSSLPSSGEVLDPLMQVQHLTMLENFYRACHLMVHHLRLAACSIVEDLLDYEEHCAAASATTEGNFQDWMSMKSRVLLFLETLVFELSKSLTVANALSPLEIEDRVKFVKMCWSEIITLVTIQLYLHHYGAPEHQEKQERLLHLLPDPVRRGRIAFVLSELQRISTRPEDFSLLMAFQTFNPGRPNMDLSEHGRQCLERVFLEASLSMETACGGASALNTSGTEVTSGAGNNNVQQVSNSNAMENLEMEDRYATLLMLAGPLRDLALDLDDFLLRSYEDGSLPQNSLLFETYCGGLHYQ